MALEIKSATALTVAAVVSVLILGGGVLGVFFIRDAEVKSYNECIDGEFTMRVDGVAANVTEYSIAVEASGVPGCVTAQTAPIHAAAGQGITVWRNAKGECSLEKSSNCRTEGGWIIFLVCFTIVSPCVVGALWEWWADIKRREEGAGLAAGH